MRKGSVQRSAHGPGDPRGDKGWHEGGTRSGTSVRGQVGPGAPRARCDGGDGGWWWWWGDRQNHAEWVSGLASECRRCHAEHGVSVWVGRDGGTVLTAGLLRDVPILEQRFREAVRVGGPRAVPVTRVAVPDGPQIGICTRLRSILYCQYCQYWIVGIQYVDTTKTRPCASARGVASWGTCETWSKSMSKLPYVLTKSTGIPSLLVS